MRHVVFRVDASTSMGLGHLLRCLALAQAFKLHQADTEISFVMLSTTVPFAKSRLDWSGNIVCLPDQIAQQAEPDWLQTYCQQQQVSALIVDGYQFDTNYRRALAAIDCVHVLFDDNNNSGPLYSDLVINPASKAHELDYAHTAKDAVLCLGETYRILRAEFSQITLRRPWLARTSLVLVMGGSDPQNLSLRILIALEQVGFNQPITLATGGAYAFLGELRAFLANTALQVEHLQNCQQIAQLFGQAKLVVSAAGGSQFELLACHTPALLLVVADNQRMATQAAVQQGWCQAIDYLAEPDIDKIAQQIVELWQDSGLLENMHRQATQFADTGGAKRVVEHIRQLVETTHHA